MYSDKPVEVKSGKNIYKPLSVACIVVAALVIVVVIVITIFYVRKVTFTERGVEQTFRSCKGCTGCLTCLSPYSGDMDLVEACEEFSNTFQCSAQLIYLYDRKDYQQPCYSECYECQACLQKTAFGSLEQANHFSWNLYFRNLFHDTSYVKTFPVGDHRKKRTTIEACCETSATDLPYAESHLDGRGTTWHPVWFNIPWESPTHYYQWYKNATCVQAEPSCDDTLTCDLARSRSTFLMSSKSPDPTYGYTYSMVLLPSSDAEFRDVYLPSYCHCTN